MPTGRRRAGGPASGRRKKSTASSKSDAGSNPPDRRALLDTNVIVSAVLFGGSSRRVLERGLRGVLTLVTSPHLMDELEAILQEKFAFTPAASREVRAEFEAAEIVVRPASVPDVCRDPDDNHVLAAGLEGGVDWIVTGDADLLVLDRECGVAIVRPGDLDRLLG